MSLTVAGGCMAPRRGECPGMGGGHILAVEPPLVVRVASLSQRELAEVAVLGHWPLAGVTRWGHRRDVLVISALLPVGDSFQRTPPRVGKQERGSGLHYCAWDDSVWPCVTLRGSDMHRGLSFHPDSLRRKVLSRKGQQCPAFEPRPQGWWALGLCWTCLEPTSSSLKPLQVWSACQLALSALHLSARWFQPAPAPLCFFPPSWPSVIIYLGFLPQVPPAACLLTQCPGPSFPCPLLIPSLPCGLLLILGRASPPHIHPSASGFATCQHPVCT